MSQEHVSYKAAILPPSAVQQLAHTNTINIDFEFSKQLAIFKWVITCAVPKQIEIGNISCKRKEIGGICAKTEVKEE